MFSLNIKLIYLNNKLFFIYSTSIKTMAYIPPQRRNNTFSKVNETRKKSPSPIPIEETMKEENFPTLGSTIKKEDSTMNFAASISAVQPKKEVIKDVPDGWVRINKNKEPRYVFGKVSDNMLDVLELVEHMNERRRIRALEQLKDRLDYYEWLDIELNGPKYLSNYEIRLIEEEEEREKNRLLREQEGATSSEESDYETFEYN